MTKELEIKLLTENATMPKRNRLDAGYDIYSAETVILEPQEKAVIKTDVAVNIPEGFVGLLTSRSGVSSKTHLVIETEKIYAGSMGNLSINIKNDMEHDGITSLYEDIDGELVSTLDIKGNYINEGEGARKVYKINKGDKLAQLVIVPIFTPELTEVEEFKTKSKRGAGEMNNKLTIDQLIKKVEQWSKDKDLHNGNPDRQALKFYEEAGEVGAALSRGQMDALKDGIGDTVVTLIILAQQHDMTLQECLQFAYDEIKGRKGKTLNGTFIKESDLH